jgi:hypothetical protein
VDTDRIWTSPLWSTSRTTRSTTSPKRRSALEKSLRPILPNRGDPCEEERPIRFGTSGAYRAPAILICILVTPCRTSP